MAVINLLVLITRFCVEMFAVKQLPWNNAYFRQLVDFVIASITILVIAIPEGLPVAVMVSLAYSVKVSHASLVPKTLYSTRGYVRILQLC